MSSLGKGRERKAVSAIRNHLNVIFEEDKSRAWTRNAAKNLGTLGAMEVNRSRKNTGKGSLKGKRYKDSLLLDRFL